MDERAGTGAVILARRHWTHFIPVRLPHFLVTLTCARVQVSDCIVVYVLGLRLAAVMQWHYCYQLLTFRTPCHHPCTMNAIDLL